MVKKVESFETHHRIVVFLVVVVGTIILTRLFVSLYNPNPVLFNLELHHFDYGVLLLLISSKLLLFGPKNYSLTYLFLTGVASGLIIDDYWFIRNSLVEHPLTQIQIYNATFPSVVISVLTTVLIILFIQSIRKKRQTK